MWLTEASSRSCATSSISTTCAPHACQQARTRATDAAAFSGRGVSTTARRTYSPASAASGPVRSPPAIGCPGTKQETCSPSAWRAAMTTCDLVLPASVSRQPGRRWSRMRASIAPSPPTGVDSSTRSARAAASSGETASSIRPSSRARASDAGLRPTPRMVPTCPAWRNAAANEPPIKPTPATASTGTRGPCPFAELFALIPAEKQYGSAGRTHAPSRRPPGVRQPRRGPIAPDTNPAP